MPELRLVPSHIAPRRNDAAFAIGRRYCLAEGASLDEARRLCADQDIVIGGYRIERTRADIIPADPHQPDRLFIWNSDAEQEPLRGVLRNAEAKAPQSSLLLANAGLEGPVLLTSETQHRLSLTAVFELEWRSHTDAARLAAVELVQSTRNIRFEDGSELCLLDTGKVQGPVRYTQGDDTPLKPVAGHQDKVPDSHHRYSVRVGQHIPERLHGKAVADVTVLEKYTSHFLMCEDPRDVENHIWVPAMTPVMWGWSIRVGRRTDGEWGILRRKLLMPTSLDTGPELPLWQVDTHQIAYSANLIA